MQKLQKLLMNYSNVINQIICITWNNIVLQLQNVLFMMKKVKLENEVILLLNKIQILYIALFSLFFVH